MHTSTALKSSHFAYWQIEPDERTSIEFGTFCLDYHEQDRVATVSQRLEDGVLHTSYALLALTTAFYDVQRARTSDFFTYPQHFAFIAVDQIAVGQKGVATGAGHLVLDETAMGAAWSQLDVWPASNWITAPGTPVDMLQKVCDFQINRLFWPQDFKPVQATDSLPDYARKLLKARLKSVYYYNTSTPTVEIQATQSAADIVQKSIERLPEAVHRVIRQTQGSQDAAHQDVTGRRLGQCQLSGVAPSTDDHRYRESYRQVSVDDFLADMDACFEAESAR